MPLRQIRRRAGRGVAACVAGIWAMAAGAEGLDAPDAATVAARMELYTSGTPVASPLELAPMRAEQEVETGAGLLRLTSLHPGVNSWFLVESLPVEGRAESWHLENADAEVWHVSLVPGAEPALRVEGPGGALDCRPWAGGPTEFETAAESGLPYAPVCGGRLYLRNKVSGSRSNREAVADFLRENVMFGDELVNLIKGTFFEDAFMETTDFGDEADTTGAAVAALGQARLEREPLMRTGMRLPVVGAEGGMAAGHWYAVEGQEGIFASVMQPGLVSREILEQRNGANWLDGVERAADVYLAAFDLGEFELGYELGTNHPSLGWSSRPSRQGDEWRIPGPDGFDNPAPLVFTGMLNPGMMSRVAAAFAGGFKRDHGAWRLGEFARTERGHHYGFLANGVTFSRLLPGLATLYVMEDGTIGMKTWTEEDSALVPHLQYARQNGVSLVERDPETGESVPGPLVTNWMGGNWSGSAEAQLRTLRAGACLRNAGGRQFLIYGYFSSVTPSGMARTFQAYGCDYGMLLDMNAPELTYLAVYKQNAAGDGLEAMHLGHYMDESDPRVKGVQVPRFVTFSDYRDFFYLLRKE